MSMRRQCGGEFGRCGWIDDAMHELLGGRFRAFVVYMGFRRSFRRAVGDARASTQAVSGREDVVSGDRYG